MAEFIPREVTWFSGDKFHHPYQAPSTRVPPVLSGLMLVLSPISSLAWLSLWQAQQGEEMPIWLYWVLRCLETAAGLEMLLLLITVRIFMHCCYRWHPKWIV